MLDTYGRKYIRKYIKKIAKIFIRCNLRPNQVTVLALFIGILSSVFLFLDWIYISVILLWFSGLLDVVDGSMARILDKASLKGMFLDIVFDRIVEGLLIIIILYKNLNWGFSISMLFFSILLSMTIFLLSGQIIKKSSYKSFYYQAGMMERTEGFIFLSLIIIFKSKIFIWIFTFLILFTATQRFLEVLKYFHKLTEK